MFRKITLMLVAAILLVTSSYAQNSNLDIAINYLKEQATTQNLTEADISEYVITDNYVSKHNQVNHIYLNQQYKGLKVHNAMINFNIKNGKVLFWNNHFVSDLQSKIMATTPVMTATAAAKAAAQDVGLVVKEEFQVVTTNGKSKMLLSKGGIALEEIPVELKYYQTKKGDVHLVWQIVIYEKGAQNKWNVKVDATNNQILDIENEVLHCNFNHDHFGNADRTNRKLEAYHAVGVPYKKTAFDGITQGNMISSYNVFAMPIESPIHGNRTIEVDPHDLTASPFGWHDDDGVAGAEYTITRGNNVHAYSDASDANQSQGDEPDGGTALNFDFPLDLTMEPDSYKNAAITNLFYWNNMMHDVWYSYGFDESSGNFQENNYGNGGSGSDFVVAEAQDGGGVNNANMATPNDGGNPRMQMYLWDNTPQDQVIVNSPSTVAGSYPAREPSFGPGLPSTPLTGKLVFVDDGTLSPTEGCNALTNGNNLAGNIAFIDRGNCQFGVKILNAENAGAVAAIICNNVNTGLVTMAPGTSGGSVTIPSVFMTQQDCQTIRVAMSSDSVMVTLQDVVGNGPGFIDGDFDNGVIAHEYTHGISNRLTAGPNTGGCLGNAEQAGEGWSDWFGLVMTVEPGDIGTDKRGMGVYAANEGVNGDGIRTYAYSTDFALNAHTHSAIINESVPHGVGSVFAAMLWDLYWALVDEYGWDADIKTGTGGNNMAMQLVIDGLKFQSCSPSFTESRDAILAADLANYNGANECLIWEVFAKRGLGWSSASGDGDDLNDFTEAFDIPPYCLNNIVVTKTGEDEIQAGDKITYTIKVDNFSSDTATNVIVRDTLPAGTFYVTNSGTCNATESNGVVTLNLGTIAPQASATCTFEVNTSTAFYTVVSYIDSFETNTGDWIELTDQGNEQWERKTSGITNSGSYVYHAINPGNTSDFSLASANPVTISGTRPALTFWHRYRTNQGTDGGTVEISNDFLTWTDLGQYMIKNGYNSVVNSAVLPNNSRAFTGNGLTFRQTIVDLSSFAGQNVYFRFRMTSDDSGTDLGWFVDDVSIVDLYTIDNTACGETADGKSDCGTASTIINATLTSTNSPQNDLAVYLYPNPTKDLVNVNIQGFTGGEVNINVVDVAGRNVLSENFNNVFSGSLPLNVKGLAAGVYFVKIQTDKGTGVERLVINK